MIATALPEDEEYLRTLGASESVDRNGDVAAAVRERHPDGVDALLDLVSYAPEGFDAYAAALTTGGRGVSPLSAAGDGPGRSNVMAIPTPENLERLAGHLEAGDLRCGSRAATASMTPATGFTLSVPRTPRASSVCRSHSGRRGLGSPGG